MGTALGRYQPSQVRNSLYRQFAYSGDLKVAVGWEGDAAYIYTGLAEQDGEAHWTVSIEMIKRSPEHRAQLSLLAQSLASETWTLREVGDTVAARRSAPPLFTKVAARSIGSWNDSAISTPRASWKRLQKPTPMSRTARAAPPLQKQWLAISGNSLTQATSGGTC